jgi:hypothetical protein
MRKIKKREKTKLSVLKRREEQKGKNVRGYCTWRLSAAMRRDADVEISSDGIIFSYSE